MTHFDRSEPEIYAHYTAVAQSSGMGKSRTVDEMAKDHLVIPINLRETGLSGTCSSETK